MQPTYLPWMGYFALIDQVDTFVLLDDVKFNKRSWQQRNRIKTDDGPMWLTVPVLTSGRSEQFIQEVEISTNERWRSKHLKSVQLNYASAAHYSWLEPWLEEVYEREWTKLRALNGHIIKTLSEKLELEADFVFASELGVKGRKAHRLVNICQVLGATEYLSPLGSREYIEADNPFPEAGIDLYYQHFEHPTYQQLHGDFVSHMSVIDLMLNEGPSSLEIIRSGERAPYTSEEVRQVEA